MERRGIENRNCGSTVLGRLIAAMLAAHLVFGPSQSAPALAGSEAVPRPEILFIGDSQLSFGAGRAFRKFFADFEKNCKGDERWPGQARAVEVRRIGIMGVKSTALHTWVSRHRSLKKMVCVPDPKWPVNARLYGFPHRKDGRYVQLGKDKSFPFCRRRMSAMEAVFDWTMPQLLVLYFMGNTIDRWANSPKAAKSDVDRFMKILPKMTGCVFMTSSPVYRRRDNRRRVKAQQNIQAAFAAHEDRCTFVPMLTPATINAIQGKASYFRRHKNGRVKDPYHPGAFAAGHLIRLQRRTICRAVLKNLRSNQLATIDN